MNGRRATRPAWSQTRAGATPPTFATNRNCRSATWNCAACTTPAKPNTDTQNIAWTRRNRQPAHRRQTNIRQNHTWTGQDVADFISVSVYTGLRISDVCLFHIDRMEADGAIRLRMTKAGTHVCTWVPEWLQERIRTRAKEVGPYIFGEHQTKDAGRYHRSMAAQAD